MTYTYLYTHTYIQQGCRYTEAANIMITDILSVADEKQWILSVSRILSFISAGPNK